MKLPPLPVTSSPRTDRVPLRSELLLKRAAVLEILDSVAGGEGIVLTSSGAISWYLGGARVHVSLANDPIVIVIVSYESDEVVVSSSEATRLEHEELPSHVVVRAIPWLNSLSDAVESDPRRLISERQVDEQLRAARGAPTGRAHPLLGTRRRCSPSAHRCSHDGEPRGH